MANITLKLDDALVIEAKVLAARNGTSVSRMVAEQLEALVRAEKGYDAAQARAVKRLRESRELNWTPPRDRAELHER